MGQAPPIARAGRLGLDVELRLIRNSGMRHPSHWHEDLQIIATIQGRGEATVQGQAYPLPKGTLIVIPPSLVHTARAATGEEWSFQSLHAAPERLGLVAAKPVLSAQDNPADQLFRRLQLVTSALFDKGQNENALLVFDALLSDITERVQNEPNNTSPISARLTSARAELADRLSEPLPVSVIAKRHGWSVGHFSREFHRAFFMPPHAWRLNARIEAAKRHLRRGGTVADAPKVAGFLDLSHFSRHYRQATGITARTYAARYNAGGVAGLQPIHRQAPLATLS